MNVSGDERNEKRRGKERKGEERERRERERGDDVRLGVGAKPQSLYFALIFSLD